MAAAFCLLEFTVAELRRVYEAVRGRPLDPRNSHRKGTGARDFLVPTGATTTRDGGRPAQLYRRGPARLLHPPLLRADGSGLPATEASPAIHPEPVVPQPYRPPP